MIAPARSTPGVRVREARHRRGLLLGIATLILLALAPVVGQHVLGAAHEPLTGIDHVGALCLVALHTLLGPVHVGLHWLVLAGLAAAALGRARAMLQLRSTLGSLTWEPPAPGDAFSDAAAAAGLPRHRLRIVEGLPVPAFTAGWVRPVVYVARQLGAGPARLATAELVAVLAHERAHVRRLDPLRFSILRSLAHALFWIPALRRLADDVADEAEIRADDAALAQVDGLTLAAAIVSLAAWRAPTAPFATAASRGMMVGFTRRDLVARRVRRLAGEETVISSSVTARSMWGAILALTVVWVSGIVDLHALPPSAHGSTGHAPTGIHCEHPGEAPYRHLFCRRGIAGTWLPRGSVDCPHATARVP